VCHRASHHNDWNFFNHNRPKKRNSFLFWSCDYAVGLLFDFVALKRSYGADARSGTAGGD